MQRTTATMMIRMSSGSEMMSTNSIWPPCKMRWNLIFSRLANRKKCQHLHTVGNSKYAISCSPMSYIIFRMASAFWIISHYIWFVSLLQNSHGLAGKFRRIGPLEEPVNHSRSLLLFAYIDKGATVAYCWEGIGSDSPMETAHLARRPVRIDSRSVWLLWVKLKPAFRFLEQNTWQKVVGDVGSLLVPSRTWLRCE